MNKLRSLFNNETGFARYLKNTSWLMVEKIARMVLALTIGAWVIRYLGPEEFGILSYAQSFVGLFTAFSSLGLYDIIVRELVKNKSKHNLVLGTSFGLQTLGSTLIMVLLIIGIWINNNDELTNKIILILGLITFINSFNVITSYFDSIVKSKYFAITGLIGLLISSLIKIFLILKGYDLIHFVYVLAFDVVFLSLGLIYFYQIKGKSLSNWRWSKKEAWKLLKDAWPLVLSGIIISIYMKIDQVMIKEFLGNSEVGKYSAAVRLSEACYFIPMVICSSLFPAIINSKLKSETLYKQRLQHLYNLMVTLAIAITIPVILLSDWLINLLYGLDFVESASVLNIHIISSVFVFLGVANQKWFISENLQKYNVLFLGIGMVFNVILNIALIPYNGIIGAAVATLVSQFIASVLAPVFSNKTRSSFFMMLKALFLVDLFKKGNLFKN